MTLTLVYSTSDIECKDASVLSTPQDLLTFMKQTAHNHTQNTVAAPTLEKAKANAIIIPFMNTEVFMHFCMWVKKQSIDVLIAAHEYTQIPPLVRMCLDQVAITPGFFKQHKYARELYKSLLTRRFSTFSQFYHVITSIQKTLVIPISIIS